MHQIFSPESILFFNFKWPKYGEHFLTKLPLYLLERRLYEVKIEDQKGKHDPCSNCIKLQYEIGQKLCQTREWESI